MDRGVGSVATASGLARQFKQLYIWHVALDTGLKALYLMNTKKPLL